MRPKYLHNSTNDVRGGGGGGGDKIGFGIIWGRGDTKLACSAGGWGWGGGMGVAKRHIFVIIYNHVCYLIAQTLYR